MILYNSLLVITLICKKIKISKLRKVIFYFLIFVLSFFNIFRHESIGNDTSAYIWIYKSIKYKVVNNLHVENGYFYYNKALNILSEEEITLLIGTGIIIFYGIYILIKKYSINIFLSLYIFIGLRYYGTTMNLMRQMIAVSLLVLAFDFIIKKESKKGALLVMLGSLFHKTALVFFVIIFLKKIKYSRNYYILMNISSLIIVIFSKILLNIAVKIKIFSNYENYFGGQYFTTWNFGTIVQLIISFITCFFYYYYFIKNNNRISLKVSIYGWISSLSVLFTSMALMGSILSRVALYFSIFNIIIIPLILKKINNKIVYLLILIFIYFYHYFTMLLRPEWNYIYPYKFYWS